MNIKPIVAIPVHLAVLSCLAPFVTIHAAPPMNWTQVSPDASVTHLNAVALGDGKWVTLSQYGKINRISEDQGMSWEPYSEAINASFTSSFDLQSRLVYADGAWMKSSDSLLRSSDLTTWTPTLTVPEQIVTHVHFANGLWVAYSRNRFAVINGDGRIHTSADGLTWIERFRAANLSVTELTYGDGKWVALYAKPLGESGFLISDDAVTWTQAAQTVELTETTGLGQPHLTFANGTWLFGGARNNKILSLTSPDLVTWTETAEKLPLLDSAFGNGIWVGITEDSIHTSADGKTWTARLTDEPDPLRKVSFGDGQWVVVGDLGVILASSDGVVWKDVSRRQGSAETHYSVGYENGLWTTAGASFGGLYASPDGRTWTKQATSKFSKYGYASGNGVRVALASFGSLAVSTDGLTWSELPPPRGLPLFSVDFGQDKFLAVGSSGGISSSTDGVTWETISPNGIPESANLGRCVFSHDRWFTMGWTSLDGVNWTPINFPQGMWALTDVAYGDGRWIAVTGGRSTAGMTSTDGVTWTSLEIGGPAFSEPSFLTIAYGEDAWVATGEFGFGAGTWVYVSSDGVDWTAVNLSSIESKILRDIEYADGTWVIVGDHGYIYAGDDSVQAPPTITSPPSALKALEAGEALLEVTAEGTTPFSYQWQKSGVDIPGATARKLNLSQVSPEDGGDYRVIVTNPLGSATSDPATLTIVSNEGILELGILPDGTRLRGAPPLNNLGEIVFANDSELLLWLPKPNYGFEAGYQVIALPETARDIQGIHLNDSGQISCCFTTLGANGRRNNNLFIWQNGESIVFLPFDGNLPKPLTLANNGHFIGAVSFSDGDSFAGTATPFDFAPIATYEGQRVVGKDINAQGHFVGTSGSTSLFWDGSQYQVIEGFIQSIETTLRINDRGQIFGNVDRTTPGVWLPEPAYGFPAGLHTFSTMSGRIHSVSSGGTFAGDTSSRYYVWIEGETQFLDERIPREWFYGSNLATNSTGQVLVSINRANANSFLLIDPKAPAVPPVITTAPLSQTAPSGSSITFTVVATGDAPISYQWSKNGVNLPGETLPSLTFSNIQESDAADYTVKVTNAAGSLTSTAARLIVETLPSIITQPQARQVIAGNDVTLSVAAQGTAPLSYQWSKDTVSLPGETGASLVLRNVQVSDRGMYVVTISNALGSLTSAPVLVSVISPPSITETPMDQTVTLGGTITLNVAVEGTEPFTYTWTKDGNPIPGATTNRFTRTSALEADAGAYSVMISNDAGSVESVATVIVQIPPSIVTQPVGITVEEGEEIRLEVQASGEMPLLYQWRKDDLILANFTEASLVIATASLTDTGAYSVIVSNPAGERTSASASVLVNEKVIIPTKLPRFGIRLDGDAVILTWDGPADSVQLESANSLAGPFTPLLGKPVQIDGANVMRVLIGEPHQYFRAQPQHP